MVAFATAEDLATYIQRDLSAAETATATQALDIATEMIRGYTRQVLSVDAGDIVLLDGRGLYLMRLPERPVTALATVKVAGVTLVSTEYQWTEMGFLERVRGVWPKGRANIEVTYTHGYTTIPEDIRGVTLELASDLFGGVVGQVAGETLGPYQYTTQQSNGTSTLSDDHRAILGRYRPVLVG